MSFERSSSRRSLMSLKTTTAPTTRSSSRIGVLVYSTGKLVPSLRQYTSASQRWTVPSCSDADTGHSLAAYGLPSGPRVTERLVAAAPEDVAEVMAHEPCCGRVRERRHAVAVDAVDPLAGGVQQRLVAAVGAVQALRGALLGLGHERLAAPPALLGQHPHADVAREGGTPTTAPRSSRIGDIEIETSTRSPDFVIRCVSNAPTVLPAASSSNSAALAKLGRHEEVGGRTDRLVAGVAVHPLRGRVPLGDDPRGGEADDRVRRAADERLGTVGVGFEHQTFIGRLRGWLEHGRRASATGQPLAGVLMP